MNPAADTSATGTETAGVVDLEERNWLPRHVRGETGAFEELLTAYRKLVLTLLVRWGVEARHRDDLFQEIFLKVHQAAGSYRPGEPLKPWLVSIVLNTVRNHRRERGRRRHAMYRLAGEKGVRALFSGEPESAAGIVGKKGSDPSFSPAVDEQVEREATLAWLERRIAGLPDPQREVLVLSTVKGLKMREIATLLRLPENTVKTHLRRARLALAEALAARDDPAAAGGATR